MHKPMTLLIRLKWIYCLKALVRGYESSQIPTSD